MRYVCYCERRYTLGTNRARMLSYAMTLRGVAESAHVLFLRRYNACPQLGAVLDVELKKTLTWPGVRQAETECFLWGYHSQFPFIQLITDRTKRSAFR